MIAERIHDWAKRQPRKAAVIWNDASLSYLSFSNAIQWASGFFEQKQLPVGGTALVLVHDLLNSWIIVLALRTIGLNTILVRSNEDTETLNTNDVACIVTTPAEATLLKNSNSKLVVIASPAQAAENMSDLSTVSPSRRPFGGHVLYTSGTTGTYKKVMLSGKFEDRRNHVRAQIYSFNERTIYHGLDFELWTGTAFKTSSAIWHTGGCVVLDERPEKFQNFLSHGVNFSKLLPWQLRGLIALQRSSSSRPVDGLALSIGGGFLPIDLAEQAARELTGRLGVNYSSTEINSMRLYSNFETKGDLHWLIPTDEKRVQIVDDGGRECPVNQEGELRFLLDEIDCQAYLDDAEANAKVFREGFFYPGDMAVKREDGRVSIRGRITDVVVLKGEKLNTASFEQEIQRNLQAEEVCLFSGLNRRGEDELIIAIQTSRTIFQSELETIARTFPRFEKVRFSIRAEFPHMPTGRRKINRTLLKKLVFEEFDQR